MTEWAQTGEREWTYGETIWRVWEIRGGRFLIMAHQPGRVKRGEHPTYVKLPRLYLERYDAMAMVEALHMTWQCEPSDLDDIRPLPDTRDAILKVVGVGRFPVRPLEEEDL